MPPYLSPLQPSDEELSAFVLRLLLPYLTEVSDERARSLCMPRKDSPNRSFGTAATEALQRLTEEGLTDEAEKARVLRFLYGEKEKTATKGATDEGEAFVLEALENPLLLALKALTPREAAAIGAYYREGLTTEAVAALLNIAGRTATLRFVHRSMSRLEGLVLRRTGEYSDPPSEKTIALYEDLEKGCLPPQRKLFVEEVLADTPGFRHDYQGHLRILRLLRR